MRECVIHAEDPCGASCDASCTSKWHHRPAVRGGKRPLCRECRDSHNETTLAERLYAAQSAYACGYYD